jgi:hypothetical protein
MIFLVEQNVLKNVEDLSILRLFKDIFNHSDYIVLNEVEKYSQILNSNI